MWNAADAAWRRLNRVCKLYSHLAIFFPSSESIVRFPLLLRELFVLNGPPFPLPAPAPRPHSLSSAKILNLYPLSSFSVTYQVNHVRRTSVEKVVFISPVCIHRCVSKFWWITVETGFCFSNLLVSCVMFHSTMSEQAPDTQVKLIYCLHFCDIADFSFYFPKCNQ